MRGYMSGSLTTMPAVAVLDKLRKHRRATEAASAVKVMMVSLDIQSREGPRARSHFGATMGVNVQQVVHDCLDTFARGVCLAASAAWPVFLRNSLRRLAGAVRTSHMPLAALART